LKNEFQNTEREPTGPGEGQNEGIFEAEPLKTVFWFIGAGEIFYSRPFSGEDGCAFAPGWSRYSIRHAEAVEWTR
jgi:hypothetical protein